MPWFSRKELRPQPADRWNVEYSLPRKSVLAEKILGPFAQRAPQPARQRNCEAHLPAPRCLRRHIAMEQLPQDYLPLTIADLGRQRQTPRKLDNAPVEEGCTNLERNGH